jgi:hypothetical protein
MGEHDVDLDGNLRTGGDLAGRRDYQAVQEIFARSRPAAEVNYYAVRQKNSGGS